MKRLLLAVVLAGAAGSAFAEANDQALQAALDGKRFRSGHTYVRFSGNVVEWTEDEASRSAQYTIDASGRIGAYSKFHQHTFSGHFDRVTGELTWEGRPYLPHEKA